MVIKGDLQARRCIRRTWPGGSEFSDIKRVTKADLARELDKVDAPRLVVAGGGSPCQGFSLLSAQRQHFKDERLQLFFDMAGRLDDLKALCAERNIQFLGLVENVVMDEKDRDEMTESLGWRPHLAQSGGISRVRRPRFYWLSHGVPAMPWLELQTFALMPDGPNCNGSEDGLPTFTRPIKRKRPPIDPAVLKYASVEAKHRWKEDHFRFPPYVCEEKFLLATEDGRLQKAAAYSKELVAHGLQGGSYQEA